MDFEVKKVAGQTVLYFGTSEHSGIGIILNKSRRDLEVYGWYDGCIGISGGVVTMGELEDLMKRKHKREEVKR